MRRSAYSVCCLAMMSCSCTKRTVRRRLQIQRGQSSRSVESRIGKQFTFTNCQCGIVSSKTFSSTRSTSSTSHRCPRHSLPRAN
jgi:hypothetical protein